MILTIDVGNTNTCLGGFDENEQLTFESRIDTDRYRMADQYAITISDILRLYGHDPKEITGAIISSVVPPVTGQLKEAIEKLCRTGRQICKCAALYGLHNDDLFAVLYGNVVTFLALNGGVIKIQIIKLQLHHLNGGLLG